MAAITKGIVTSFANTPQAKDDSLGSTEDAGVLYFDVMGNDLAGGGKSLYSLDDGVSPTDLLVQDTPGAVSYSSLGARIWITADGRVAYDAGPIASLQSLGAGQLATDSFTYAIRMGNGALSWATATVQIMGTNDAPVGQAESFGVLEDSGVFVGQVAATDADANAVLAFSLNGPAPAGLTFNADGSYSFDACDAAYQSLAAGESKVISLEYTVTDDQGAMGVAAFVITVTGTNDAPVVALTDVTGTVTELVTPAGQLTDSGTIAFSDVDQLDTHSVIAISAGPGALGALTASVTTDTTGGVGGALTWNYSVNAAAVESLAQGETKVENFTVTLSDGNGGNVQRTVAVTVRGTNDAPLIEGSAQSGAVQEDTTFFAGGQFVASDVDHNALLRWSVSSPTGGAGAVSYQADYLYQLDNLKITKNGNALFEDDFGDGVAPPASPSFLAGQPHSYGTSGVFQETGGRLVMDGDFTGPALGIGTPDPFVGHFATVRTNIDPLDLTRGLKSHDDFTVEARYDLMPFETGRQAYGIRLTDRLTQPDGTVVNAGDDRVELVVQRGLDGVVRVRLQDDNVVTDSITVLQGVPLNMQGGEDQIVLRLTHDEAATGVIRAAFDVLDNGVVTRSFNFNATGRIFGLDTATASDDENWTLAQTVGWSPALTEGTVAGTYGTLAVDADGTWNYNLANGAPGVQALAAGQVVQDVFTVRVTDEFGAADTETVTVNVTGTNDAIVINAADLSGAVTELVSPAGQLSDSGTIAFSDVDMLDTHSVVGVSAGPGALGALSAGVTADSTGGTGGVLTWTYNVDAAAVEHLAAGQTKIENFTVTLSDGNGSNVSRTVAVTLTGTNDAPVITAADTQGAVTAVAVEAAAPSPLVFTVDQYLGYQSNVLATLRSYVANHSPSYSAQTNVIDFTDDPGGFAGELPGSVRWPAAQALNVNGTGGINDVFFARITADFSVPVADTYTFRTYNDDGVFLLIDNNLVIADTGYHPEAPFNGSIGLGAGNHSLELFFFENGGEASLEFSAKNSTGTFGLVGGTGGGFGGSLLQLVDAGTVGFSDVDLTDAHLVSAAPVGANLGSLTVAKDSDTTGTGTGGQLTWSYKVTNAAVAYLAAGESKVESFTVTVNDQRGGVASREVDVTINGTNDGPVIGVADLTGALTEAGTPAGSRSDSGTLAFTDLDLSDVHSVSSAAIGATLGSLSVATTADTTGTGLGGLVTWTYTVADAALEPLAAGETKVESFVLTLSDGHGGDVQRTVAVTLTGTNDTPVIGVADLAGAVTERVAPVGQLTDSGSIAFTDVDGTDTHSVTAISAAPGAAGTLTAVVTGDTTGGVGGVVTWNYSVDAAAVESLAAGQTKVDSFTVTLSDGKGGNVQQTVAVTITGTNDAPVITGGNTAGTVGGPAGMTASGLLDVIDIDNGATLAWFANGGAGGEATTQYGEVDYTFSIDQLQITRNGTPFFSDDFGNGAPPPSGALAPNGQPIDYSVVTGVFTESNGRAVMDDAFAGPTVAHLFTAVPYLGHAATLLTNTSNSTADLALGLKIDDDFTVVGRYDLTVPDEIGEAYGIRLTDRTSTLPGDDAMELVVRRGDDGVVRVQFLERDYAAGVVTPIAGRGLDMTQNPDQIVLRLAHDDAAPGEVRASYDLLKAGVVVESFTFGPTGQIFGTETPGNAGDDELWTRAQVMTYSPGQVIGSTVEGSYGALSIGQNGYWMYQLDASSQAYRALGQGVTATETFTVVVADQFEATDSDTITITVTGVNDAPVAAPDVIITNVVGEAGAGVPSVFAESETNNTIAGADMIARSQFGVAPSSDVGDASLPRVSINGRIGPGDGAQNDVDFFGFTLRAGETIVLDIDYGMNSGTTADTMLSLFDSAGTLLGSNDDSSVGIGGGGSVHNYDPYLQFTAAVDGTYYAAVTAYPNYAGSGPSFSGGASSSYNNGDYVLNVSANFALPSVFVPGAALTRNDADIDGDSLSVSAVSGAVNGAVALVGGNLRYMPPAVDIGTSASVISESETNNTIPGADMITRSQFGVTPSGDVGDASLPRVSIEGRIGPGDGAQNDVDFFGFTLRAGETIVLDIDYGMNSGTTVDTMLGLFNGAGTLLASNDDSSVGIGGGGSVHNYDPYLQFTAAVDGTYYAAVTAYPNYAASGPSFSGGVSGAYNNGDYVLNASLIAPAATTTSSSFSYTVNDGHGGVDTELVSVTVVSGTTFGGTSASETLIGGTTNDTINGGGGDDWIVGSAGSDTLTGGTGRDRFDFNNISEGGDTITDFTAGAGGDVLDIKDVLAGYNPSALSSFVQLQASGGNTVVAVDFNGAMSGSNFSALVTLQGVSGLLLNDLVANGNLIAS